MLRYHGAGIGSDLIVKKLHMNRFWCLFISSSIFCAAQICGACIENPNYLIFVSGLTGRTSRSNLFDSPFGPTD